MPTQGLEREAFSGNPFLLLENQCGSGTEGLSSRQAAILTPAAASPCCKCI